jgi:hypothetical protein
VKHAQNIDVSIVLDQIGDTLVTEKKDSHMATRSPIAVAHLRKLSQHLGSLVYAVDGFASRAWILGGNVLEDVLEPTLSFYGPAYLGHERMRRAISSFDMVRPASESASPRSTIM